MCGKAIRPSGTAKNTRTRGKVCSATSSLKNARVDLTQGGLYTLSDGTRQVLASVREPITLRLFVSRTLTDMAPGLAAYSGRVRELLERYVALANGKITRVTTYYNVGDWLKQVR